MAILPNPIDFIATIPPLESPLPLEIDLPGEPGDFGIVGALGDFTIALTNSINENMAQLIGEFGSLADAIDSSITGGLAGFGSIVDTALAETINRINFGFDSINAAVTESVASVEDSIAGRLAIQAAEITSTVNAIDSRIGAQIAESEGSILGTLSGVAGKIFESLGDTIDAVQELDDVITNKITEFVKGEIDDLERLVARPLAVLTESLPLQVLNLADVVKTGLEGIPNLPEALGEQISGVFTTLANSLGLDQLLGLFSLTSRVVTSIIGKLEGAENLETVLGSWDVPKSTIDQINTALSTIPIIGAIIQTDHPAEFERMRQNSFEHTRPTQLDVGSTLELIRRFPDELDSVLGNLRRNGLDDSKIDSLLRIRHTPLQMLDNLDGWRRGEIDEQALDTKLRANGLSDEDGALAKRLSRRIPPIADLILFSVRGVFDVEESRRFGEFEGLPPALEAQFIEAFGIEGGDFSRQVQVFADAASKLGLPEEWVAAYWTAHWRLPSLQNAYQMFHRLAPDIVDAEREDFIADGFDPENLKFDRESLDRLVRAADFSGFWRDKLSAIAFNPLTRVDIRRMHKLGILDDAATQRAYRKVGFSSSDADKMLAFTVAFNGEPDAAQTDEIRSLTKNQILDFVENELFTEEEGIDALTAIGYDEFAAVGFVDLELAKRDRTLQRTAISLVEERVLAGLIDINEASLEFDILGVSSGQKALVIRELDVKLTKRTRQPSRAELDTFIGNAIISVEEYRVGMLSLGYTDEWVERFVQLNAG